MEGDLEESCKDHRAKLLIQWAGSQRAAWELWGRLKSTEAPREDWRPTRGDVMTDSLDRNHCSCNAIVVLVCNHPFDALVNL